MFWPDLWTQAAGREESKPTRLDVNFCGSVIRGLIWSFYSQELFYGGAQSYEAENHPSSWKQPRPSFPDWFPLDMNATPQNRETVLRAASSCFKALLLCKTRYKTQLVQTSQPKAFVNFYIWAWSLENLWKHPSTGQLQELFGWNFVDCCEDKCECFRWREWCIKACVFTYSAQTMSTVKTLWILYKSRTQTGRWAVDSGDRTPVKRENG